ncbi:MULTISPECIES: type IV secretory system conjugative DNA transfer family protein [Nocardia]|jgi:hypothetical protein|uniref:Uncharacterized protein n=1 Tax=Nocardia ignorata TaxID=145285 RepID=A0A4R6PP43_NOCIG|nr:MULTISPECIES: hypothetical protein [Nocardia]TDP38649.1 hypothetical protein DFR75_103306 [Nocardia ignorata]
MREVISAPDWNPDPGGTTTAMIITVTDHVAALPRRWWGQSLVWNPELCGPATAFRWDLLAAITDATDADRIAEALFSVVQDEGALFFVPEASLMTANLLLAAVRGRRNLTDVLDWIHTGNLNEPYRLLDLSGEHGPTADMDTFRQAPAGEQAAIWAVVRQAVLPLDYGPILAALSPQAGAGSVMEQLPRLESGALAAHGEIFVVEVPGTRSAGVAAALRAELLLAAQEAGVSVQVVNVGALRRSA